MNGMKPSFLENKLNNGVEILAYSHNCSVTSEFYNGEVDPYVLPPSCHINLLELSRYAKKMNKKLIELSQNEIDMFAI